MFNPENALGLTENTPNDIAKNAAFKFVRDAGYVILGTISLDSRTPTSRGMELHILDDSGDLYFGTSKGKPLYNEINKHPHIVATAVKSTVKRLSVAVRINSVVEEIFDSKLIDRYWELNPGTKSLYRKDLENFRFFKLIKGDGEVFHVCEDDKLARVRFSFGGGEKRPFRYYIDDNCIGCSICKDACLTQVIEECNDKYAINHYGCLECGKCYEVCPNKAVKSTE